MSVEPARAKLKIGIVIMAVITSLVFIGAIALGGIVALLFGGPQGLIAGPILIAVALLIAYLVSGTNLWVEVAGDSIRERRLFTCRIVERPVADVARVIPLVSGVSGVTEAIMDALLATTNRGYLIRFRSGGKIGLVRADNSGVDQFIAALKTRLQSRWTEVTATPRSG